MLPPVGGLVNPPPPARCLTTRQPSTCNLWFEVTPRHQHSNANVVRLPSSTEGVVPLASTGKRGATRDRSILIGWDLPRSLTLDTFFLPGTLEDENREAARACRKRLGTQRSRVPKNPAPVLVGYQRSAQVCLDLDQVRPHRIEPVGGVNCWRSSHGAGCSCPSQHPDV